MSGGINLASKYSKSIDERFYKESQAALAVNNDYEFTGVKTVNVYSIPAVAMSDYSRSGTSRYGTPNDLSRNVQTLTVSRDRAFTFIIDKGDKLQSMKATDAGKALNRQIREVIVPEYDAYVFRKLAAAATLIGNAATEEITAENASRLYRASRTGLLMINLQTSLMFACVVAMVIRTALELPAKLCNYGLWTLMALLLITTFVMISYCFKAK